MIRILIVDDEKPARELLKIKVDWKAIGCEIVCEARDGSEALKAYKECKPDLVITDIQMPGMDGLLLVKNIKSLNKNQPIIILSCHESFEYARKAIKLGVEDYLIKDTYSEKDIITIIDNIFKQKKIKQNISTSANINKDRSKHKSIAVKSLVFEGIDSDGAKDYIDEYDLNLKSDQYSLLYIDIDRKLEVENNRDLEKQEIKDILRLIRTCVNTDIRGEVCYDEKNSFVVIVGVGKNISQSVTISETNSISKRVRSIIKSEFDFLVTMGISKRFNGLDNVRKAYDEGKEAVSKKIFMGYNSTFYYENNQAQNNVQFISSLNMKLDRIKNNLKEKSFDLVGKDIQDLFLQNLKGFMQYNYLKHINWQMISIIMKFCSDNNIEFNNLNKIEKSPWEELIELNSVDMMCKWFLNVLKDIELKIKNDDMYSYNVKKTIDYIQKNYSNNFKVSDISDALSLNSAYLSRIFKNETGKSISDYLIEYRVSKAKDMILSTDEKLYNIATMTGFSSQQSFYTHFKKVVGKSPGDYRKS